MVVLTLCDKVIGKDLGVKTIVVNSGETLEQSQDREFTWGSLRSSRGKLVGRKTAVLLC